LNRIDPARRHAHTNVRTTAGRVVGSGAATAKRTQQCCCRPLLLPLLLRAERGRRLLKKACFLLWRGPVRRSAGGARQRASVAAAAAAPSVDRWGGVCACACVVRWWRFGILGFVLWAAVSSASLLQVNRVSDKR
jgi:hypothetical protein